MRYFTELGFGFTSTGTASSSEPHQAYDSCAQLASALLAPGTARVTLGVRSLAGDTLLGDAAANLGWVRFSVSAEKARALRTRVLCALVGEPHNFAAVPRSVLRGAERGALVSVHEFKLDLGVASGAIPDVRIGPFELGLRLEKPTVDGDIGSGEESLAIFTWSILKNERDGVLRSVQRIALLGAGSSGESESPLLRQRRRELSAAVQHVIDGHELRGVQARVLPDGLYTIGLTIPAASELLAGRKRLGLEGTLPSPGVAQPLLGCEHAAEIEDGCATLRCWNLLPFEASFVPAPALDGDAQLLCADGGDADDRAVDLKAGRLCPALQLRAACACTGTDGSAAGSACLCEAIRTRIGVFELHAPLRRTTRRTAALVPPPTSTPCAIVPVVQTKDPGPLPSNVAKVTRFAASFELVAASVPYALQWGALCVILAIGTSVLLLKRRRHRYLALVHSQSSTTFKAASGERSYELRELSGGQISAI